MFPARARGASAGKIVHEEASAPTLHLTAEHDRIAPATTAPQANALLSPRATSE